MKNVAGTTALIVALSLPTLATSQDTGWVEQHAGTQFPLRVVQAVDENVVWAAGTGGEVLRTVDGGNSWSSHPTPYGAHWALSALDDQICLVSGAPGIIWRTDDGGVTWTPVHDAATFVDGLYFFDALNGWAVGDPIEGVWVLLETSDGGMSWTPSPGAPSQSSGAGLAHSFAWQGTQIGLFGTNQQSIWRTSDGGASWVSVPTNIQQVAALALGGGNIGLAGGDLQSLDRSTDAGLTWDAATPPQLPRLLALDWVDGSDHVWGITGQWGVYQSTNCGIDWVEYYLAEPFDFAASDVSFASEDAGWVVGCVPGDGPGRIWSFTQGVAGVGGPGTSPVALRVTTAPNPFRTDVTFAITGEAAAHAAEIAVYDVQGRAVARLHWPGSAMESRVHWDGRRHDGQPVSDGVYYYRISTAVGVPSGAMGTIVRLGSR